MKVISVVSTKGGSGKTTTVMGLASAALAAGHRTALIDGDSNGQVIGWRQAFDQAMWKGIEPAAWPEALTVESCPTSTDELYERIGALEDEGVDLVIIDTRGGTGGDSETLALAADLVLVPTRPVAGEWRQAIATFEWMRQLFDGLEDQSDAPDLRAVFTNVPQKIVASARKAVPFSDLTANEKHLLDQLAQLPFLETMIPQSKILQDFADYGPLTTAIEMRKASRAGRLHVGPVEDQLMFLTSLYDEVQALDAREAA